ncbi:hypothetical protein NYO99_11885 [Pelomonas sp. UHG3]|uniref:Uncharacterized protein n=1 Tax=Roseateles hydrophilus TaxID=2975054 RepID=A0ACC6CBN5_9BURK|nr:hypothetical protein [Pelomonas sp. UHG3]MCY4745674.1 hypothetical protein [Pelomonas sp. UHG3]
MNILHESRAGLKSQRGKKWSERLGAKRLGMRKMARAAFEGVGALYEQQLINSERSLQAAMWHELRQRFEAEGKSTFKIYVEPRIRLPKEGRLDSRTIIPDLVVCNDRSVIAVIELKFSPKGAPGSAKDFASFERMSIQHDLVKVQHTRWFGEKPVSKPYPFANSVLFVWAAVGKRTSRAGSQPDLELLPGKNAMFMRMFLNTANGTISCDRGGEEE